MKDKEFQRVIKLVARLLGSGKGYHSTGRLDELKNLTAKQLRNIKTTGDLVKRGYVALNLEQYMERVQVPKEEKRARKAQKKRVNRKIGEDQKNGKTSDFYRMSGETLSVEQSDDAIMSSIDRMIKDAIAYDGHLAKDQKESARWFVNSAGRALSYLFDQAKESLSNGEIVERLKKEFGNIAAAKKLIKSLLLSVYDKVYAVWAGGEAARSADFNRLAKCLGVENTPEFL